jgi:hypothetical protein
MQANDTAIRWVIHLWTLEPEWLAILMMEKITLMRAVLDKLVRTAREEQAVICTTRRRSKPLRGSRLELI